MKFLLLPLKLVKFWYPGSLIAWIRIWKNVLNVLEEDLAVRLMFRLLFVPLFHDSSFVGKFLSFFFRLFRIAVGLFAYILASLVIISLALVWFITPFAAFIINQEAGLIFKVLMFSGVTIFIHHILSHPEKKTWQIKKLEDLPKTSFLPEKEIEIFNNDLLLKLLKKDSVKEFLLYLEITPASLAGLEIGLPKDLVWEKAWDLSKKLLCPYLKAEHFLTAYLQSINNIDDILAKFSLRIDDFILTLEYFQTRNTLWRTYFLWDDDFQVKHLKGTNRGWLGVPTPNLDAVGEDLTRKACQERLSRFVGRSEVLNKVINILSLEKGRNVVIVGEAGSGRTSLVEHLAGWIVSGDAPDTLATKRIVSLDLAKLLSGIKSQGELAERVTNIFGEVKFHGNVILFIDEIQQLKSGEAGSLFNLFSLMQPYLESSDFQFLGITDPTGYSKILQENSSFARLFSKVDLPPATVKEALPMVFEVAIDAEKYQKVKVSVVAQKKIIELSERFVNSLRLPDSAIQTFERCIVKPQDNWVTTKVVEEVIQEITNVPIGEAGAGKRRELLNLEKEISLKVVGQEEAVIALADTLRRAAADLREGNRPIGSFLFVGPTGVGKTEAAKALAETYFEGKGKFLRFDMSEYQGQSGVDKLIGKTNEEGHLTESVKFNPFSLVLLDEFEKSDPLTQTLFLQVLEDGRLTDGTGKLVDFTNTIIIATSNVGSLLMAQGLKQNKPWNVLQKQVMDELLKVFKPELVNRFDKVVLFKPLSEDSLEKIVKIKLSLLQEQLKTKGYLVDFDQNLVKSLAKAGFDPVLGARPLRRLVQDKLEAKLSKMILSNQLSKGKQYLMDPDLLSPN